MKRFYREVSAEAAEDGHRVLLDGKPVRTPGRRELRLPTAALAQAVAEEWRRQETEIDPRRMPLTRLVTTGIDLVAGRRPDFVAQLLDFARHDVLCYRVGHPRELVIRQSEAWDPWLDWAERVFGIRLAATSAIASIEQSETALRHLQEVLDGLDDLALVGVHAVARLTHSIVLALAVAHGALGSEQAFRLGHLEELWEIEQWGEEREQVKRHAMLRQELAAAARLLHTLRSND